jgi:hypothetical protein
MGKRQNRNRYLRFLSLGSDALAAANPTIQIGFAQRGGRGSTARVQGETGPACHGRLARGDNSGFTGAKIRLNLSVTEGFYQ